MMLGRKYAAKYLQGYGSGTVGNVVKHAVEPFAKYLGDFASGNVGGHYSKDVPHLMAKKATRTNLMRLAIRETDWWNQQPGLPGLVGSMMSHRTRFRLLNRIKKNLPPTDE